MTPTNHPRDTAQANEPLYFYADASNEPVGPLPLQKLRHLRSVGVISDETLVIENGGCEWKFFSSVVGGNGTAIPPLPAPKVANPQPLQPTTPNFDRLAEGFATGWFKGVKAIRFSFGCLAAVIIGGLILAFVVIAGIVGLAHHTEAKRPTHTAQQPEATPTVSAPLAISEPSKEQARPVAKATPQPTPAPTPAAPKRFAQFETFRLGNFAYEIKEVETTKHLGAAGWATADAGPESVFVVVRFSIKSESNGVEVVHSNDFRLRTAEGREFGFHDGAVLALTQGKDAIFRELRPGVPKDAATAFELPLAALDGELILMVPEKGFFGTGKIEVVIKPKAASTTPAIVAQATPAPRPLDGNTGRTETTPSGPNKAAPLDKRAFRADFQKLYAELLAFKDSPSFHENGFSAAGKKDWLARIQALKSLPTPGLQSDMGCGLAAGCLEQLGREYRTTKGRENAFTSDRMKIIRDWWNEGL